MGYMNLGFKSLVNIDDTLFICFTYAYMVLFVNVLYPTFNHFSARIAYVDNQFNVFKGEFETASL